MYCLSTTLPRLGLGALMVLLGSGCKSGSSRFASIREPTVTASPVSMRTPAEGLTTSEELTTSELATSADIGYASQKPVVDGTVGPPSSFDVRLASAVSLASQLEAVTTENLAIESGSDVGVSDDPMEVETPPSAELAYSLQGAIATSLTQNPDLVAARGQEQVSSAAVGVAETYIWNPFVQSQIRPGDSRGGEYNYYIWLMQRFELAHQQSFREQSAMSALNQTRWTIHQTELTNIATTTQFYLTALYQRELLVLADQTRDLNEELLGIVDRRYNAGVGSAPQVTTAKVSLRQSQNQSQLASTNFQTALLALRRQLNLSSTEPLTLTDRLPAFTWNPASTFSSSGAQSGFPNDVALRLMADELAEGRPDVLAALSGVNVACANARLAKAAQTPDVQIGPILDKNANGSYDVGARLQRDLFVFNNGRPLTRQRNAEWQQQNRVYTQLKTRASREAETAINRYERARLLAQETRVDLSPFDETMPQDLKDIKSQFEAGQADILMVYATQNALLQERRIYLDSLNEVALSVATVVQSTALPVDRIVTLNDPSF